MTEPCDPGFFGPFCVLGFGPRKEQHIHRVEIAVQPSNFMKSIDASADVQGELEAVLEQGAVDASGCSK